MTNNTTAIHIRRKDGGHRRSMVSAKCTPKPAITTATLTTITMGGLVREQHLSNILRIVEWVAAVTHHQDLRMVGMVLNNSDSRTTPAPGNVARAMISYTRAPQIIMINTSRKDEEEQR